MIKTKGLTYKIFSFDENTKVKDERIVLDDINIQINRGEFVAILGHNASGKTTFAKHLNALLLPSEGSVFIEGEDTKVVDELWKIRKKCAMVFQNPDNQIVGSTVEEDIAFGPENLGIDSMLIKERVNDALEKTGMIKFKYKSPNYLSGGQKQRVAIASAFAMKPDCIILDEPTAMLDPKGRNEVMDILTKLNKEENMTIVLITHHMEEAAMANRIVVMEAGRPVLDKTPREIFTNIREIKLLKLDVPQVMELAYRLWKYGKISRYDVLNEKEFVSLYEQENYKILNTTEKITKEKFEEKEFKRNSSKEILKLENVSMIYEKGTSMEVCALDSIDLSINKGEFVGIIGHTGSGKSTIVQLMNGLIKPTDGKLVFDGIEVYSNKSDIHYKKRKSRFLNRKKNNLKNKRKDEMQNLHFKVGVVFQYPESQLFEETIIKDVMFGPLNKGFSKDEAYNLAKEALKLLGMNEDYYDRSPFELSGGEMRKVAIAGVIAMEPEVIILDEPVAGLDPANKKYLLDVLKNLQKEKNKTIVMVSHDMEDIAKYTDRLVVIDNGKIKFDDKTRNVLSQIEELENIDLVSTPIAMVVNKLKEDGYLRKDIRGIPLTVEEAVEMINGTNI